jgi:pimeloyl-ACP methyl ester carboxylesterase
VTLLAAERHGEGAGPPLLIAHGLFGSARNWRAIARALARRRPVIAVDMRNHGASFRAPSQRYADMAGDLAAVIAAEGGCADLLGHSMGGKAAMMLALTQGSRLRRLVVADIAPAPYSHSHAGFVAAMQAVDLARLRTRADAEAALAPAVPDAAERAFLLQSLAREETGWRWTLNLPALGAAMAELAGWPDPGGRFDGPALFLSGARSSYVRPEHRAAILARFPRAEFAVLEGAGHWLHAERPREFIAAVDAFLSR